MIPKLIKAPGAPKTHWKYGTQVFSPPCPSRSRWGLSPEMPVVRPGCNGVSRKANFREGKKRPGVVQRDFLKLLRGFKRPFCYEKHLWGGDLTTGHGGIDSEAIQLNPTTTVSVVTIHHRTKPLHYSLYSLCCTIHSHALFIL